MNRIAFAFVAAVALAATTIAVLPLPGRAGAQVTKPRDTGAAPRPGMTPQVGGGGVQPDDDTPPAFNVIVDPTLTLTADQQALYQQAATILCAYSTIPASRTAYYSAIDNPPDPAVVLWQGLVQNVQADATGYVVTVFVTPTVTSSVYGAVVVVLNSDYTETFHIANGVAQYTGFSDPAGLSGSFPSEIEGY